MAQSFKNRSVDAARYAMVPRSDVPRSAFKGATACKTAFDCGKLVPIYLDEVLPGDSHSVRMTAFARLGTVLYPVMDNLHLETFFFFVPNRLIWSHWVNMMGEQNDPADSISYIVPQITSAVGGWPVGSLADYFGLPTVGQVDPAEDVTTSSLPLRAYWLIYNQWFRDQNLQDEALAGVLNFSDGPDHFSVGSTAPQVRCKRPDYFTTCLPWPAKPGFSYMGTFGTGPSPYLGAAGANFAQIGVPVTGIGAGTQVAGGGPINVYESGSLSQVTYALGKAFHDPSANNDMWARVKEAGMPGAGQLDIAVTINSIRQAFQVQRMQERDARGGTRYTELLRSHFGVSPQDSRLQRPEYLGGGSSPVSISPIAQQSATGMTGATTPLGHLSATATGVVQGHGFSQSFSEHGWIIGLANVRADLNYYHGVHKMWHRSSKFDFYWPAFAQLGEQAVLTREIYMDGTADDLAVFGFQERWAEYRSKPGMITGRFRGTSAGTLDSWHLAERFLTHPVLNSDFVVDGAEHVVRRALAAGAAADGQQVLFDAFFDLKRVRALPVFSVPGLVDHF